MNYEEIKSTWKHSEPMNRHTTFRIGGPADYFAEPVSIAELKDTLAAARALEIPYFVIGNGSNLLVSDEGYRGLVIQLYKNWNQVEFHDVPGAEAVRIRAFAGALMTYVAHKAADAGLTGMEPMSGIPGTLGGAVVMNAGAYGKEIKDVLVSATVLSPEGEILTLSADELKLSYRNSIIPEKDYIVLEAELELTHGDREAIAAGMEDYKERRNSKQPLELPSAGSTFKRPEGYFAGKLITDAGMKGYRVGDAMVSEKHAGFVVNVGNATAGEVVQLIEDVRAEVKRQFGVYLETEVKFLGEF